MNKKLAIRGRIKVKGWLKLPARFVQVSQILLNILITTEAAAITKTSIGSGNWNNAASWTPSGIPTSSDDVTIAANHIISLNSTEQCRNLSVASLGKLNGSTNSLLTINGNISVNGTVDMNSGNITLANAGSSFSLGSGSIFIWNPGANTSVAATLFTDGIENFNSSSTLIIKRWYDYTIPLGEVVTGNFGNLTINSPGGNNSIVEWNQRNKFESHRISGTLTIDQGWVTLDKTGAISSTTIGNITLTSVNSTFIGHNGSHPTSFTITTNSITNNGGKFYGLNDGNGNISLKVNGNFTNTGNVKIINNTGVSGVSNGNALIRIDGDFIQSLGDTRFIYNVTTTNSGTFNATIKNLNLTGGIFMGQNAIHTGGQINILNITQDLAVNFINPSDKFRGCGLTSIGATINNAGFALNVGRDLFVNGSYQAEFTTSASSGSEMVTVHNNMVMSGCTSSFNYGTLAASHASQLFVQGNLIINGGTYCVSRNNGSSISVIEKDIRILNGLMVIKANEGAAILTVNGSFNQSGGNILLHSNTSTASGDVVKLQVKGTFKQSGGSISYDDNVTGAENIISLLGDSCIFSGTGEITHAGSGTSNVFGRINYEKNGKIYFSKTGTEHLIDQTIQSINQQCELIVTNGKINLSTHILGNFYTFKVMAGGKLSLNNSTLLSNGLYSNGGIYVDSAATVSLTNADGFYGNPESAICNGINFSLHNSSVVEYASQNSVSVTGASLFANQIENKYGILRIILSNPNTSATLNDSIFVRTRLELIDGKLTLNNHRLTIENGNATAIKRLKGYIETDYDAAATENIVCWKNMNTGIHLFPFGRTKAIYLPVKFNLISGAGNDISISTRRTDKNNLPYPTDAGVLTPDRTYAESKVIDRWWTISARGVKSDITFTYSGDENTIVPDIAASTICALQWSGSSWKKIASPDNGVTTKAGTINLKNVIGGSHFVIASAIGMQLMELKSFEARRTDDQILLNWQTLNETTSATFIVEKSIDGINFHEIGEVQNTINLDNSSEYKFTDAELPQSVSYYRIKLTANNEVPVYSEMRIVTTTSIAGTTPQVKINSVSPNPFSSTIKIQFSSIAENAILEIIDAQGRKVLSKPADATSGELGYTILDLGYLRKGIYFLNIISNGKKDTMKIIKNE